MARIWVWIEGEDVFDEEENWIGNDCYAYLAEYANGDPRGPNDPTTIPELKKHFLLPNTESYSYNATPYATQAEAVTANNTDPGIPAGQIIEPEPVS